MSKSDEFFVCTPIVIEIQRCENTYFSPKCCTTWETDTEAMADGPVAAMAVIDG